MDDQLVAIGGDEHDDLDEVGGAVGTDDQPPVGVFAEVVDDKGVSDGVEAVPAAIDDRGPLVTVAV